MEESGKNNERNRKQIKVIKEKKHKNRLNEEEEKNKNKEDIRRGKNNMGQKKTSREDRQLTLKGFLGPLSQRSSNTHR